MKTFFGAFLVLFILVGAGCGASELPPSMDNSMEQTQNAGRSTALTFHIETAASDLRNAVADATGDNLEPTVGFVQFAQMTLPAAVGLAEEEGLTEDADTLKALDARLTKATTNSATLADLVAEVNAVADALDNM